MRDRKWQTGQPIDCICLCQLTSQMSRRAPQGWTGWDTQSSNQMLLKLGKCYWLVWAVWLLETIHGTLQEHRTLQLYKLHTKWNLSLRYSAKKKKRSSSYFMIHAFSMSFKEDCCCCVCVRERENLFFWQCSYGNPSEKVIGWFLQENSLCRCQGRFRRWRRRPLLCAATSMTLSLCFLNSLISDKCETSLCETCCFSKATVGSELGLRLRGRRTPNRVRNLEHGLV